MKKFIFLIFLLVAIKADAQLSALQKEKFHFGNTNKQDTSAGYAQAIKVDNILYISGSVSRDVSPAGITRVYRTLEQTLEHYGAGFQHVVKENLYTTDIEAMKKFNEYRKVFYKGDFPAATWVQITRLFMPDAKLEVELIAHLPETVDGGRRTVPICLS